MVMLIIDSDADSDDHTNNDAAIIDELLGIDHIINTSDAGTYNGLDYTAFSDYDWNEDI